MIQQIQSEEEDDDIDENEGSGSDVNADIVGNTEDQSSVDEPRAVLGCRLDWRVVSIKPGGVKAADHNQYVEYMDVRYTV